MGVLDMDLRMLARIDTDIFKYAIVDTAATLQRINSTNDFKSLSEVIASQK